MSRAKRAHAETAPATEETSLLFLSCQNQALSLEMHKYRRQIAETRKELETARLRCGDMETITNVIKRAWSQLEFNLNMLLDDRLGETDGVAALPQETILKEFLSSGSSLRMRDPTDTSHLPQLDIDQWSSTEEINAEFERNKKIVLHEKDDEEDDNKDKKKKGQAVEEVEEGDVEEDPFSKNQMGDHLLLHSAFTLAIIERLCVSISEAELFSQTPEVVSAIAEAKDCYAERFALMDNITKLSAEIEELEQNLFDSENKKAATEAALNPTTPFHVSFLDQGQQGQGEAKSEDDESSSSSSSSSTIPTSAAAAAAAAAAEEMIAKHAAVEKELRRKIAILDRQIAESEASKAKVETLLTQKLNRPLTQTEEQTAFIKKAMETLRAQSKLRVQALITESQKLSQRVATLELAVSRSEAACVSKVAEAKVMIEGAIKQAKSDKETTRLGVHAAQAEASRVLKAKARAAELQNLEKSARSDCNKLNAQIRQVMASQEKLREELAQSRSTERELEDKIWQSLDAADRGPPCAPSSSTTSNVFSRLESLQAHAQSLSELLLESQASVNDLTLEIEGVATEESKTREQTARTLQQIAENISMQRGVVEENVKLSEQAAEILSQCAETDKKIELCNGMISHQEKLLLRLKAEESSAKAELSSLRKHEAEKEDKNKSSSSNNSGESASATKPRVGSAALKLQSAEKSLQQILKKNNHLQSQCDNFARQLDKERRLRFNAQREEKPQPPPAPAPKEEVSGSKGATSLTEEETALLDSTLGILRCSVCKDRFKSVAITRCYHLFCKECIDENLRNRHRKCPACGEKFGSDDVRSVSFTD